MKQTVNIHDFRDAFRAHDRYSTFSHEGYEILFNYLEELEQGMGEEMELDVIAICCDWSESDAATIAQDFNIPLEFNDDMNDEERADALQKQVLDYLNDNTSVAGVTSDGSIIYSAF